MIKLLLIVCIIFIKGDISVVTCVYIKKANGNTKEEWISRRPSLPLFSAHTMRTTVTNSDNYNGIRDDPSIWIEQVFFLCKSCFDSWFIISIFCTLMYSLKTKAAHPTCAYAANLLTSA